MTCSRCGHSESEHTIGKFFQWCNHLAIGLATYAFCRCDRSLADAEADRG